MQGDVRGAAGRALTTVCLVGAVAAAAQAPAAFDSTRAYTHVREQVALGPRPAGSPANQRTREYIIRTLAASGYKAVEQPFETSTPVGRVKMANIIATLPGDRADRIVLASHFDTKPFEDFRFVGANDSGSSTGVLLELARVLRAGPKPALTLEFLFFDGEEAWGEWRDLNHTYGSRHYVTAGRASGTLAGLKALVLLDMVGDRGLSFRRDTNSTPWLTDIVWAAARRLGHGTHFLDDPFAVEDDHIPFLKAGVPSVDLIDLDYAPWHTAGDTLDQVSARSLQIVGDVVLAALPEIQARLLK
ncbi:MAG TPA: M28 family peptidase [Vicinamibacterales bacterium]|nr:M28 family peptidase [Vicinamibacterales bacterium]